MSAKKTPRRRKRGRNCLVNLVVLAVMVLCGGGAASVALTALGEPNNIRIDVRVPEQNPVAGQEFTIEVEIENVDLDPAVITAIGLEQDLLDGLRVARTDPAYRSVEERDYPIYGAWSEFKIQQTVAGGSTLLVTVNVTAPTAGTFAGDLTVWVEADVFGFKLAQARRETLEITVQ